MNRRIIEINEELCNGCEKCVTACHEGAIEMVNGKARLISDTYCDGLGDCLPECPTGAINMIERDAEPYDEALVMERIKERERRIAEDASMPCGCPGNMSKAIKRSIGDDCNDQEDKEEDSTFVVQSNSSQLSQWPVQINLIHPQAPYLKNADLLIAADCTAYAYGNFHQEFIKGRKTLIGCPKLDDNQHYQEKLTEIIKYNQPKSITVIRMQVPCCAGIVSTVKQAMLDAQTIVSYREITITTDGRRIE